MHGHRDNDIDWNDEKVHSTQGNFIELIRFRAETDNALKIHLKNAPKNAKYASKTIQEQLISIIDEQICNEILDEVADKACDISNKEQLSISICYVLNGSLKEMLMDFVSVVRITGSAIAEDFLSCLSLWKLQMENLRGKQGRI